MSDQGNSTEDCIDNEFAQLVFCNCNKIKMRVKVVNFYVWCNKMGCIHHVLHAIRCVKKSYRVDFYYF